MVEQADRKSKGGAIIFRPAERDSILRRSITKEIQARRAGLYATNWSESLGGLRKIARLPEIIYGKTTGNCGLRICPA
jgi:hypothetical protein